MSCEVVKAVSIAHHVIIKELDLIASVLVYDLATLAKLRARYPHPDDLGGTREHCLVTR